RRLSYSALSLFEQCSYKYYARYVVGMHERPGARAEAGMPGLSGTEIGDAVHRLLEILDLAAPAVPRDCEERVLEWYPRATEAELDRIRSLVEAYCTSELAGRVRSEERRVGKECRSRWAR